MLDTRGRVWGWGENELGQLEHPEPRVTTPVLMTSDHSFMGLRCGPGLTLAWSAQTDLTLPHRAPFVIEICEQSFRLLDQLLTEVWEGLDGRRGRPPTQEQECVATAALNLLRLQLVAMRQQGRDVAELSLGPGTKLLASLKKKVVELASTSGVLDTVQVLMMMMMIMIMMI